MICLRMLLNREATRKRFTAPPLTCLSVFTLRQHPIVIELADAEDETTQYVLKSYDAAALQAETDLLIDWYLPLITKGEVNARLRKSYQEAWAPLYNKMTVGDQVVVLRDYHAQNLLWLPRRDNVANVGLLDFQDAVLGSPAYDLVSLLEDARRDVDPALAQKWWIITFNK